MQQQHIVTQGVDAIPSKGKIVFDSVLVLFITIAGIAGAVHWLLVGNYAVGLTLAAATLLLAYWPFKAIAQDIVRRSRALNNRAKLTLVKSR